MRGKIKQFVNYFGMFLLLVLPILGAVIDHPHKTAAISFSTGDFTNPGAQELGDLTTVKFISSTEVQVTVNSTQGLLKDSTKAAVAYGEAYSGTYKQIVGNDQWLTGTGCGGELSGCALYALQDPKTITQGSSKNSIRAFLMVKGKLGSEIKSLFTAPTGMTIADARAEAQKHGTISLVLGVLYDNSGNLGTNDLFRYGDVNSGRGRWSDDSNTGFDNLNNGIYLEKGFVTTPANIDQALIYAVFSGGTILVKGQQFAYCEPTSASGTIKRYFQANNCSGGGDLIFDDSWQTSAMTKEKIMALFEGTGVVEAKIGNESKSIPIKIAQGSNIAAGSLGTGLGGTGNDEPTCESAGSNLSWVLCPIINGMLDVSQGIFNSVIVPFLKTSPISTKSGPENTIYSIWSSFRTIGNILLIFGLLFIVFGQTIGGGMVDAYTAKKAMPRILVAAVLINLSIYLVAISIDIFNVLGNGIGNLITAPLKANNKFNFTVGSGTAGSVGALVGVVALFGFLTAKIIAHFGARGAASGPSTFPPPFSPPIAGNVGLTQAQIIARNSGTASGAGSASTPTTGGGFLQFFLLFILLPVVIITLSIFATLVIRRGLIMFLTIVSPVALALFVLPQTEKYAKKWFKTLVETLMVYPIITALFSIAYVLSLTIISANGGFEEGTFSQLLAKLVGILVLFVPLAMIPFAFKLAGGVIGNVIGTLQDRGKKGLEAFKGNPNDASSLRNRTRTKARANLDYKRFRKSNDLKTRSADASTRIAGGTGRAFDRTRSRMLGRSAQMIGGAGIEARVSANQAAESKRLQEQKATGPDDSMRDAWGERDEATGLWWNPLRHDSLYMKDKKNGLFYDRSDLVEGANGTFSARTGAVGRYRKVGDGLSATYQDSTGATFGRDRLGINRSAVLSAAAVRTARTNAMSNPAAFQESLNYEMEKVSNNEDLGKLEGRWARLTQESGISATEASAVWKVVGYRQQNTHLAEKYTRFEDDPVTGQRVVKRDLDGFARQFGTKGKGYERSGNQDRDWGVIDDDIVKAVTKVRGGGELDNQELERMQHYFSGIDALDRGKVASPGGDGLPPAGTPMAAGGAPGTYFATGGSGAAEQTARRAYTNMQTLLTTGYGDRIRSGVQGTGDINQVDNRG